MCMRARVREKERENNVYDMKMAVNFVSCFKNTCEPSQWMIHDIDALIG